MGKALGEFEQLVLFALLELGDDAYGVSIRRMIEERTGRSLSAGAVYTTLKRLENRGLVRGRFGPPTPTRGGRRKRCYELLPEGARTLKTSYDNLSAMARGLLPRLDALAEPGES